MKRTNIVESDAAVMALPEFERLCLRGGWKKALFEKLAESLGLEEASGIAVAAGRDAEKEGVLLNDTVGILKGAVRRGVIQASEADRIL